MKTSHKVLVGLLVLGLLALGGFFIMKAYQGGTGGQTVVIGGVLPLTGDAATFGQNAKRGAELAVLVANERGLLPQQKFEFKAQDSRGTATDAVTAAQSLIEISGAKMLIGDVTSAGTHALLPVVKRHAIPLVSPAASDPALSGKSELFARVWPVDTFEAEVIGGHAKAKKFKRLVAVYANSDYGIAMLDEFERVVGKDAIAAKIATERETLDYRPTVERIRLGDADALFLVLYPEDGKRFLQQLAEQKVPLPLLATATIEAPAIAALPAAGQLVFASPVPPADDDAKRGEFLRRYRAQFGEEPGILSDTGYDAAMLLMEAYAARGKDGGSAVIQHIRGLTDYHGVSGRMTFDAQGNVRKTYKLKTVRDGKFVWLEP